MSKGGRGLTDDDKKLWRRVAARVKPRRTPPKDEQTVAASPRERAVFTQAERPPAPSSSPKPKAPPPDRGGEKRVRRGRVEIGGTLDLHGHNQETGRAAVVRFLQAAHARGARAVIVVTGVGRSGQGVLKRRLPEWLAEGDLRPLVSGFAKAHRTHGGEGAYYVFLKRANAP
ncbi:MAG TPA: Smr/MutS family protein [Candidatus Binatia bacterium]|nr:Smr/MutS family protein [Candidatus Binatia bacterium]